ncbi:MAG: hypothetical protein IJM59_13650 [Proteobacteria bacterium]|nr:hypothetical protein [Pseudomonadota bacterium]
MKRLNYPGNGNTIKKESLVEYRTRGAPVLADYMPNKSVSNPLFRPADELAFGDLTRKVKESTEAMLEAATGLKLPPIHIIVDPSLKSQGILAQAVDGREIRIAQPSYASNSRLMLHESVHILQQNKAKTHDDAQSENTALNHHAAYWNHRHEAEAPKSPSKSHYIHPGIISPDIAKSIKGSEAYRFSRYTLTRAEAEMEADDAAQRIMRGERVDVHPTDIWRLNQDVPNNENAELSSQAKQENNLAEPVTMDTSYDDEPVLGTGRCVVFYVEMSEPFNFGKDNKTFRRVAERFVRNRPDRCYGLDASGNVNVNQPSKFKTGKNIIDGLKKIAGQEGKVAEVYIISHGYPKGIIDGDMSSKGLLQACDKSAKDTSSCRSVEDIKAIAPDVFTKNVKLVLHACNVSKDENFAGSLYENIQDALKSENTAVYGHDDNTMAGYNCSWVQHDYEQPDGKKQEIKIPGPDGKMIWTPNPEFHMPRELQLGNHETCDKKSGYIGVR